jgi:hypothetical protein
VTTFMQALIPIAIIAVTIVLFMGLRNMMKAGDSNTSQKLMQWRIILQAIAIAVIMGTLYLMGE